MIQFLEFKRISIKQFNYTDTLLKRFGVKAVNEFHIHGMANEKESIIVGHATHPEYPYEPLRMFKNKP